MKKNFFRKKLLLTAGILSVAAVLSGIFYARVLLTAEVADLGRTFYFLVSEEENVPASAQAVYLGGGAGYAMKRNGTDYAVLSCYFAESEAKRVKNNLENKKMSTAIVKESGGILYFKKRSEKQNAEKIAGCFRTMSGCIDLLYDISNYAETGTYTQRKLKQALSSVSGVLSCLAKENRGGLFTDISACSAAAAGGIDEITRGIVYAKDVRYLQVFLADSYLMLAAKFSL